MPELESSTFVTTEEFVQILNVIKFHRRLNQTTMHDTVLPMAFNSRPKVSFSDKDRGGDDDNAEVEFTFGKTEEEEDKTEEYSAKQDPAKWSSQKPDSSLTTMGTVTKGA